MLEKEFLIKASIDIVAALLLSYGLFYRRYHNKELFVSAMLLNIFVFCVLSVISDGSIALAGGLGLFAILSMLRFRSETYTKMEITYFFGAVALAAVNGIAPIGWTLLGANLLMLLGTALFDNASIVGRTEHMKVCLDSIPGQLLNEERFVKVLSKRYGVKVIRYSVREIDYVKDTAKIDIDYTKNGS